MPLSLNEQGQKRNLFRYGNGPVNHYRFLVPPSGITHGTSGLSVQNYYISGSEPAPYNGVKTDLVGCCWQMSVIRKVGLKRQTYLGSFFGKPGKNAYYLYTAIRDIIQLTGCRVQDLNNAPGPTDGTNSAAVYGLLLPRRRVRPGDERCSPLQVKRLMITLPQGIHAKNHHGYILNTLWGDPIRPDILRS